MVLKPGQEKIIIEFEKGTKKELKKLIEWLKDKGIVAEFVHIVLEFKWISLILSDKNHLEMVRKKVGKKGYVYIPYKLYEA